MSWTFTTKAVTLLLALACPAQAASVTYDISGAFASSLGNVAGQFVPGPGGSLSGSLTFDSGAATSDWSFATVLPYAAAINKPELTALYTPQSAMAGPGAPPGGARDVMRFTNRPNSTDFLDFYHYDFGVEAGRSTAIYVRKLRFVFNSEDIGLASLPVFVEEFHGPCVKGVYHFEGDPWICETGSGLNFLHNRQEGAFAATLRAATPPVGAVPLPAGLPLMLAGMGALLAFSRRKPARG